MIRKEDREFLEALMDAQFVKHGVEFAKVNAAIDIVNVKIDDVITPKLNESIAHQKETNGRVTCLEETTIKIPKNKRIKILGVIIAAVFLVGLVSAASYHAVNWAKTFTNKTKIEFN